MQIRTSIGRRAMRMAAHRSPGPARRRATATVTWLPTIRRFGCPGIAVRHRRVPIGSSATGALSGGRWTELFRAMPVTGRRPRRRRRRWRWRAGPDCRGPALSAWWCGDRRPGARPAGAPLRPDHQPSEGGGGAVYRGDGGMALATARLIFACRPHQPATGTGRVGPDRSAARPADPLPAMDPGWDEHPGAAPAKARSGRADHPGGHVPVVSVLFPAPGRGLPCPGTGPGKAVRAVR